MLNKENKSCNNDEIFKSNLVKYILVYMGYFTFSIWCSVTEQSNIILRLMAFPFNIVLIYLIIQEIEMNRGTKYIKKNHPNLWKEIKAHAIGNHIKTNWICKSNENIQDEILIKIKKNLKEFKIITILTILYLPVYGLIIHYINN